MLTRRNGALFEPTGVVATVTPRLAAQPRDTRSVPDERSDAELIAIIDGLGLRARRILAHSMCADEDALTNLADGASWYATRKDGVESLRRVLPNEEILESLAARVRPLLLKRDPVHYGYVLNALGDVPGSAWTQGIGGMVQRAEEGLEIRRSRSGYGWLLSVGDPRRL